MNSRDFKYRILLDANPQVLDELTQKFKESQAAAESFTSSFNLGLSINLWELGFEQLRKFPQLLAAAADRGKEVAREIANARRELDLFSGGTQMTGQRLEQLLALADHPNWQLPGLTIGAKALDRLTSGALSSAAGLKKVADWATGSGNSFEQLSRPIGNAYNALVTGAQGAEGPLQQLMEMGVISAETKAELLALQAAGKQGPEVWAAAVESLGQTITTHFEKINGQLVQLDARIKDVLNN